jgi:DNA-binding transcriptional ArsR family regulator
MRKDLSPMILAENAQKATRLLKLMASEQRLMILCKLSEGEQSAGDLSELVGLSQGAGSQHLQKMKAEGLVDTRRDAQTIYYRLADDAAGQVIDLLCKIYGAKVQ